MRFEGRTAIITGSGSGLGRVLAHRFAAALPQTADVTSAADVEAMVGAAREALGPADILVNNAAKATDIDFLELTEEAWDEDVAISLKGAFLCSQAVLKDMTKNR